MNKITHWIEKIKVWIYNKKPKNKYLRVVYYYLTGLMFFILTIPLAIFVLVVVLVVIASLFWFFNYLINFSSFRIIITLLLFLLFSLFVFLIGYSEFGDD